MWSTFIDTSQSRSKPPDYFYAYFKRLHRRGPGGRLVPAMSALAAAEAGVASVLLTNPLWEVNMRQVTSATALRSEGFLQALREIVAEEGVGGLYRGVFPALLLVSVPTSQFWVRLPLLRVLSSDRSCSGFDTWP